MLRHVLALSRVVYCNFFSLFWSLHFRERVSTTGDSSSSPLSVDELTGESDSHQELAEVEEVGVEVEEAGQVEGEEERAEEEGQPRAELVTHPGGDQGGQRVRGVEGRLSGDAFLFLDLDIPYP